MSTNSTITIQHNEFAFETIYCHWDGYLDGVGRTLHDHFKEIDKVKKLVSLGDCSSLNEHIDKPEGHSFDNAVKGRSVFYGRDRGESNIESRLRRDFSKCPKEEFNYLFNEDEWFVQADEGMIHTLIDCFK